MGYKSKNTNDKRGTDSYKVRKDKRLKSFMEIITAKQKKKALVVAEQHGLKCKYKTVGG